MATRISGGDLRGRLLPTPEGERTRPTSSRVREALFSMIGPLHGLTFLDLYAGSGSVGVEAVSRGAENVVCVEQHTDTSDTLAETMKEWKVNELKAVCSTVQSFLNEANLKFEVVFIDPPFVESYPNLNWKNIVAEDGIVIFQYPRNSTIPYLDVAYKVKHYGESSLAFVAEEDL